MAPIYSIPGLNFTSERQSLYNLNGFDTFSGEEDLVGSWSESANVDEGLGKVTIIPAVKAKIFGKTITIIPEVSIDFKTSLNIDFLTSGDLGLVVGYNFDLGSITTELGYDATATFADALRAPSGQSTAVLSGDDALESGSFQGFPADLSAYLDFLYDFLLEFSIDAEVFGYDVVPTWLQPIDIDFPGSTLLRTDADGNGRITLVDAGIDSVGLIENFLDDIVSDLSSDFFNLGDFLFEQNLLNQKIGIAIDPYTGKLEVTWGNVKISEFATPPAFQYDLASLTFRLPQPAPEGTYERSDNDNSFEGSDADAFIEARADLDGVISTLITMAFKLPSPLDFKSKLGSYVELKSTILNTEAGPDARLRHDLEVTADALDVTVFFTDVDGNPLEVEYVEGNSTLVQSGTSWTGDWSDFPELTLTEATIVTPRFTGGAMLDNTTGIDFDFVLLLEIFKLGYKLKYEKEVLLSGQLGPLFEQTFSLADTGVLGDLLFIETYQEEFPLEGFEGPDGLSYVEGVPYVLDLEGTDDPGLSGIDDGVNTNAPEAVDDTGFSLTEDETLSIDGGALLANDYDLDAFDTLTLTGVTAATLGDDEVGAIRLRGNGELVFDPGDDFQALGLIDATTPETAQVTFTYTLQDAVGQTGTGTVSVEIVGENDAPTAMNDAYQTSTVTVDGEVVVEKTSGFTSLLDNDFDLEGNAIGILGASDTDGSSTVTVLLTELGASVSVAADGTFSYNDAAIRDDVAALGNSEALIDRFEYTVVDEFGATASATATFIIVGDAPDDEEQIAEFRLIGDGLDLIEGETGEIIAYTTDVPGDGFSVSFSTDDPTIALDPRDYFADLDPQIIYLTADEGQTPREATFTAEITELLEEPDEFPDLAPGTTDTLPITVNVAPAILVSTLELTLTEGEAAGSFDVTLSREPASDVVLDVSASSSLASASPAALTFTAANWDTPQTVTVTPVDDADIDVQDLVEVTVAVDPDQSDDLFDAVDSKIVDVIVQSDQNRAPTPLFDTASTDEETPITVDVLLNDTDPDGDTLTLTGASATNGSIVVNSDGTLTYTPDDDFFGEDVVSYEVSDPDGLTTSVPLYVTVVNVNDTPTANANILSTSEETAITVDLTELVDDVDGDDLSFTSTDVQNGSVVNNGDGTFTFTPATDFVNYEPVIDADGNVTTDDTGAVVYAQVDENAFFTYEVSDGQANASASVLFLVTAVNDAPTPVTDTFTITEDETLTLVGDDLIGNDTDAEDHALELADADNADTTEGDAFYDQIDETITYDPEGAFESLAEGQTATDTFVYTVEDELNAQAEGTVEVTILGVNDAPEVIDDGYTTTLSDSGVQGQTAFSSVLANDSDIDDGDTLTASLGPDSAGGQSLLGASVSMNADGSFTYSVTGAFDLDPGEIVFDFFDYTASDAFGASTDGGIAILLSEDGAPGFALSESAIIIQERTAYNSFLVGLTAQPTADVTFTVISDDTTEAIPDQSTLTFTKDNWSTPQEVTIQSVDDGIVDGDQFATITVAVDGSDDAGYAGLADQSVAVTALDSGPAPEVIASKDFVTVQEGGATGTFDVTLGIAPTSNVVVTVDLDNPTEVAASTTELTFTPDNWDVGQTITLSAVDDDILDGPAFSFVFLEVDHDRSSDDYANALDDIVIAVAQDDEVFAPTTTLFATPFVAITAADAILDEGDSGERSFTFELIRSGGELDRASTVSYAVAGAGFAEAEADDFGGSLPSGSYTFAPGETEATISLAVAGDTNMESDEGFEVTIEAVDNAEVVQNVAYGTIVNDDDDDVTTPNTPPKITGDEAVTIDENQTFVGTYAIGDDDNDAVNVSLGGADGDLLVFDEASGELTFALAPDFEDPQDDGGDNVYDLTINADDGEATTVLPVAVTVDDVLEADPTLTLELDTSSVTEGGSVGATVRRTGDTSSAVTVTLSVDDDTEASVPATVTIGAGESEASFTVTALDDMEVDGDQTAMITAAADGFAAASVALTVEDDDTAVDSTLELVLDETSVVEGDTFAATLRRTGDTSAALVVTLSVDDATEASVPARVTIGAGESEASFTVAALDDTDVDGTQFVTIEAEADNQTSDLALLAVQDNDFAVSDFVFAVVDTQSNATVAPLSDGAVVDPGADTPASERGVTASYIGDGDDGDDDGSIAFELYDAGGTLIATRTENVFPFALFGDRNGNYFSPSPALTDGDYSLTVTAYAGNNGNGSVLGAETIDFAFGTTTQPTTLSLALDAASTAEGGGPVSGTLTRTGDLSAALELTLTSSDTTAATVPATVTIPAGQASAQFSITPVDDALVDGDQVTTITASGTGVADVSASLTVTDDDTAPAASLSVTLDAGSVVEGGAVGGTVTREGPTDAALTVTLTSSDTSEATVPAEVTIEAGETSATFEVVAADDDVVDGTQTATISASASGVDGASAALQVADDDVPSGSVEVVTAVSVDGEQRGNGAVATNQVGADNDLEIGGGDTAGLLFEGVVLPSAAVILEARILATAQRPQTNVNQDIEIAVRASDDDLNLAGSGVLSDSAFTISQDLTVNGSFATNEAVEFEVLSIVTDVFAQEKDDGGDGSYDFLFALGSSDGVFRINPEEAGAGLGAQLLIEYEI